MNKPDEPSNDFKALALIKFFSSKERLESFVAGTWYCNTPQYYRGNTMPGVGDRTESCINYWDVELGHSLPKLTIDGQEKDLSEAKNILCYNSLESHDSWLQCFSLIGPYNGYEDTIDKVSKECGKDFILLPIKNLPELVSKVDIASKSNMHHGAVRYSDNPLEFGIFVKSLGYSYQKEYRFALEKCEKGHKSAREFEVGNIEHLVTINGTLKFEQPNGAIIYYSNGNTLKTLK